MTFIDYLHMHIQGLVQKHKQALTFSKQEKNYQGLLNDYTKMGKDYNVFFCHFTLYVIVRSIANPILLIEYF